MTEPTTPSPAPSATPAPAAPAPAAPAAEPAPAPSSGEPQFETQPDSGNADLKGTFKFSDIKIDGDDTPAPVVEAPTPAPVPAPAPAAPAAAPEPKPAAALTEPTAPAQPQQPQQPAAQTPAVDVGQQLKEHREKTLGELKKLYAFSDADKAGFAKDPTAWLTERAANMHYEVLMSIWQSMSQVLPNVIRGFSETSRQEMEAENAFFGLYPELKAHRELTAKAIYMFRQANPTVKGEELMQKAGLFALIQAGIDPSKRSAPGAPQPQPQAPAAPGPAPAGVGSRAAPAPAPPAGQGGGGPNIFTEIYENSLRDN